MWNYTGHQFHFWKKFIFKKVTLQNFWLEICIGFRVSSSIPTKVKKIFFTYSYRGKKTNYSYGGDEVSTGTLG